MIVEIAPAKSHVTQHRLILVALAIAALTTAGV